MASPMSKATATSPKTLGTSQIYKEAFNLLKKNWKLSVYVFLIYLITNIVLLSVNQLSIQSLAQDIAKKAFEIENADTTDPIYFKLLMAYVHELKELAIIEIVFIVIAFIIGVIINIMAIYAFSLTYVEDYVSLKEVLRKVKGNLKGPILTKLLVTLFSFGYVVTFAGFALMLRFLGSGSYLVIAFISSVTFFAILWYLYLSVWWLVSIIVSVIEEGCYGINALKRSSDLIEGRKRRGVSVLLPFFLITSVIYIFVISSIRVGSSGYGSLWSQLLVSVVMEVLGLFYLAAMVVYYYECKTIVDHEAFLVTNDTVYRSLSTTDVPV